MKQLSSAKTPLDAIRALNEAWHGSTPSNPAATSVCRYDGRYVVFEVAVVDKRNEALREWAKTGVLKDHVEREERNYLRIAVLEDKFLIIPSADPRVSSKDFNESGV